jgi:hypothetical protein
MRRAEIGVMDLEHKIASALTDETIMSSDFCLLGHRDRR